ncbi:MAG: metal-sensitive transcriptional regulator [Actinobacteria bacterium]|nr:metal-sensitive transcriptional regulator [Actinomycetota bacterium]
MNQTDKQKIITRLKRIEGQVRGLQKMIEEGRDLDDILVQVAATKRAFDEAALIIIAENMKECLSENLSNCDKAISEALDIFVKYAHHIR